MTGRGSQTLPPPVACGAPPPFVAWRSGQPEALCHVVDSTSRITGLVLPTGAGKSLITTTLATLTGWRTAILTSTKALQDQILDTFTPTGLTDLRGQRNYLCRALEIGGVFESYRTPQGLGCDLGPCKVGIRCPLREKDCWYYQALDAARTTRILVVNYQAWLAQYGYGEGLGEWDCLICDEAHAAPEELAQYLSATLTSRDLVEAELPLPEAEDQIALWIVWATEHCRTFKARVDALTEAIRYRASGHDVQLLRSWRCTLRIMERLQRANPDEWLVVARPQQYQFHPLDVGAHRELLFQSIPHVVLTSATLTPYTTTALGLDPASVDWLTAPSTFPVDRRPVIHVSTCRIDHRLDPLGQRLWLTRLDQILGSRSDRKGIVHTGSYARAKLIYESSEYRARMLVHDRYSTRDAVQAFREAGPGAVLVSPSLTTGFDFAGKACEYQVILKVPWPDSREPVMLARTQKDKTYPAYLAMQALVQAVGRGMRSEGDRCEVLILDDHVRWFLSTYRNFAPQWFLDAYKSSMTIPLPPPRL